MLSALLAPSANGKMAMEQALKVHPPLLSSSYFSGEYDDLDMVLELGKSDSQTMFSFAVVFHQCRELTMQNCMFELSEDKTLVQQFYFL